MIAKSPGVFQVVKDAPLRVRLCLAGVWLGALIAGIGSLWTGDWLSVVFFLAVIGHHTWLLILTESKCGFSPSSREKVGMSALSALILLLSIVIVVRGFSS